MSNIHLSSHNRPHPNPQILNPYAPAAGMPPSLPPFFFGLCLRVHVNDLSSDLSASEELSLKSYFVFCLTQGRLIIK